MRLYPAAHSIGRSPREDEVLNGYRIPAGATMVVSPWAVHRSPKVWSDPEAFDPRRFDVPAGQFPGGHRYAWFPFGAGPHSCVGMQLAMMEAPIVLATVLQAYRVTTSLASIPLKAAITLHPATPLPVQVHR
jgi:cytochrome P450